MLFVEYEKATFPILEQSTAGKQWRKKRINIKFVFIFRIAYLGDTVISLAGAVNSPLLNS